MTDHPRGELLHHFNTDNLTDDELIDWFAAINGIDLDTAAGEFTTTDGVITGLRLEQTGPRVSDPDLLFTPHGLRAVKTPANLSGTPDLHEASMIRTLVNGMTVRHDETLAHCFTAYIPGFSEGDTWRLFDHPRFFGQKGNPTTRKIGFTTAAYGSGLAPLSLTQFVYQLRGQGLNIRIGRSDDAWYSRAAMPVIIWNNRRTTTDIFTD